MPLSNYTSGMPINRIFDNIQKMLISRGAKQIMFDYDNGLAIGITFTIQTPKGLLPIKLPVKIERIKQVFINDGIRCKDELQPYRTGWKNVHDWIKAQLAMLDTEMVKLEEIFLPYMTNKEGQTYFEVMESKNFALPNGESESGEVIS
jgi:hypothetical protein